MTSIVKVIIINFELTEYWISKMFKKGEICIVNKEGAEYFNGYSSINGGTVIENGDKVVCREFSSVPFCTPLRLLTKDCIAEPFSIKDKDCNTWALTDDDIQSTGKFMELD